MSRQMKTKAKRWIGFFVAALLVCNLIPPSVFAVSSGSSASRVADAGGTLYYDQNGAVMTDANDSSDYAVKIGKTAEQGADEHEFDITLTVTPKDKIIPNEKTVGADIVLVFDVSTSMDWTVSGTTPGSSGWKLADTRWTALKAAASTFIDKMLGNGNPNQNRISIVVYGGSNSSGHAANSNHKVLASWSANAAALKNAYNDYEVVSQSTKDEYREWVKTGIFSGHYVIPRLGCSSGRQLSVW